ncbi:peroxidase family protein [Aestuariispira insulae]|uniref:Prostaglandin-endoperoxide synthase 2 n=1 Tax=Aestuariispira insulae TaxID=1461337 RepID=A0A3D9HI96_9PROT|nr:peroxidase family protein [Aestuariispira insulae]RED49173.1 prostaglandin-endoperoxide synthase 2 [Aestuariispira insulae]
MKTISATSKRRLLNLICVIVGTMMLYRGLINLTQYPGNWERILLGPIFLGGVYGIYLMYRRKRIGFWIFTALNFLVGIWFIYILEDIWSHHVLPHIVFSAIFLPFYCDMEPGSGRLGQFLGKSGRRLVNIEIITRLIIALPWLHKLVNRLIIDGLVSIVRTRPHPWSTVHDYVSWRGLTDRNWSARHMPPTDAPHSGKPAPKDLAALFSRGTRPQAHCPKSTLLFPTFAQYLTDGFIRTVSDQSDPDFFKKNTSNHQIDLCPLYGRTVEQTQVLRVNNPQRQDFGKLKSQMIGDEEFAPYLFLNGKPDPQFTTLDEPLGLDDILKQCNSSDPKIKNHAILRRDHLFAFGGDRVNSVPQASMLNTLLLREHNRLAGEFVTRNPEWDDDRVFETARNVVIVEFIKIVVEEYINHIAPLRLPLMADPSIAWQAPWNKPNWITTEFSLLYRWHSLIPDTVTWGGSDYPVELTFMNNLPLINGGMLQGFLDMSAQKAGALGPFNTNKSLVERIEVPSIEQGRACQLQSFVNYQGYIQRTPPASFAELSSDPAVVQLLDTLYDGRIEDMDYYIGLFAEDRIENSPLPQTILTMVAIDAFSQALTNPLLSEHVFNSETFSDYGWEQLRGVSCLADLLARNSSASPEQLRDVHMTRRDWRFK